MKTMVWKNMVFLGATGAAIVPPEPDEAALRDLDEERAAVAVFDGGVPTKYADAWPFQIQKPSQIAAAEWYRAGETPGRSWTPGPTWHSPSDGSPPHIFGADVVARFRCYGASATSHRVSNAYLLAGSNRP
jgi:hypothetical protein